jgi:hypothetical protein
LRLGRFEIQWDEIERTKLVDFTLPSWSCGFDSRHPLPQRRAGQALPRREPSSFLASGSSACDSRAISSTAGRHRRRCHGGSGSALRDGPRSCEPHLVSCAGRSARLACGRGPCASSGRAGKPPTWLRTCCPWCRRSWKCSPGVPIAATFSTQRARLFEVPPCAAGRPCRRRTPAHPIIGDVLGQVLGKQLHDPARQGDRPGARPRLGRSTHDLAAVPASEARTHPHHTLSRVDVAAAQSRRLAPTTPGGAGRTPRVQHRQGLSLSSLVAADREGPDAFYPADTPQTAKPSTTLIWEGPV